MKNVILAALLLTSTFAFAGTKADVEKVDSELQACLNSPDGQSNSGMKGCMAEAWEKMDGVLNREYKDISTTLKRKTTDQYAAKWNAEALSRLVKAERAWIQFRDADSDLAGVSMMGGSGESLEMVSASYDMEKARVLLLANLFGN